LPEWKASAIFKNLRFWSALSVVFSLLSLVLPWWGVDVVSNSYSWGVFSGLPPSTAPAIFFPDRMGTVFSTNYGSITALLAATVLLTILGAVLRRWPILFAAFALSLFTIFAFITDVSLAMSYQCAQTYIPPPESCISGLTGVASTFGGSSYIVWGFKAGYPIFIASDVFNLIALLLSRGTRTDA